jgi:hypothetical protein
LSFENFAHLNKKYSLFTKERLGVFLKLNGNVEYKNNEKIYIEALKESSKDIENILSEMR